MAIVGNKEQEHQTVSLRLRSGEQIADLTLDALAERMRDEIAHRRSSAT
jgi:threonyl-tRNA synthetase